MDRSNSWPDGPVTEWSSDPIYRVSQHQDRGLRARQQLLRILRQVGVHEETADVWVTGWDDGVTKVSDALVAIADRTAQQRGLASSAAQLHARLVLRDQAEASGVSFPD